MGDKIAINLRKLAIDVETRAVVSKPYKFPNH